MRIYRPLLVAALAASAACLGSSAQAASLGGAPQTRAAATVPAFSDGGFEAPAVPVNAFSTYAAGQGIGPWTVTSGSVDLIGPRFWAAAEGDQSVDLSGGDAGAVAQTFATTPGTVYTVSYSLAGNSQGAPVVKTGTVMLDGQEVQKFSFDTTGKTPTDMGYTNEQFTFMATKPSATLGFASTTAGAYGPVIDNVQVTVTCCKTSCTS